MLADERSGRGAGTSDGDEEPKCVERGTLQGTRAQKGVAFLGS